MNFINNCGFFYSQISATKWLKAKRKLVVGKNLGRYIIINSYLTSDQTLGLHDRLNNVLQDISEREQRQRAGYPLFNFILYQMCYALKNYLFSI